MVFVVRIFFFGLVMFVPDHPGMNSCNNTTVLLPDARSGFWASDGGRIEAHDPCLQWGEYSYSDDCPDSANQRGLDRKRIDLAFLNDSGDPVTAPVGNLRCRSGRPANSRRPTTPMQAADFTWTVLMRDLINGPTQVDGLCLDPNNPHGLVAARAELKSGTIETCSLIEFEVGNDRRPRDFDFKTLRSGSGNVKQSLAEVAMFKMTAPPAAKKLRVTLTPFTVPRRTTEARVDILPTDCGGGFQCVDLFVWNMPPEPPPDTARDGVARHFEIYYHFLKNRPGLDEMPVAMVDRADRTISEPECSPVPVDYDLAPEARAQAQAYLDSQIRAVITSLSNRPVCPMVQGG